MEQQSDPIMNGANGLELFFATHDNLYSQVRQIAQGYIKPEVYVFVIEQLKAMKDDLGKLEDTLETLMDELIEKAKDEQQEISRSSS